MNVNSPISMISESAANSYLDKDGMVNVAKLEMLGAQVEKAAKAFLLPNTISKTKLVITLPVSNKSKAKSAAGNGNPVIAGSKGKFTATYVLTKGQKEAKNIIKAVTENYVDDDNLKPEKHIAIGIKAKTEKYSASQEKKANNFKYHTKRAVKIAERKKVTPSAKVLFSIYPKGTLDKKTEAEVRKAVSAVAQHGKKMLKVRDTVQKNRAKLKDAKAVVYAKAVEEIKGILGSGVKTVLGKTIMGQETLYVQLPSKEVVTVGLSDAATMRKAEKAAKEA